MSGLDVTGLMIIGTVIVIAIMIEVIITTVTEGIIAGTGGGSGAPVSALGIDTEAPKLTDVNAIEGNGAPDRQHLQPVRVRKAERPPELMRGQPSGRMSAPAPEAQTKMVPLR